MMDENAKHTPGPWNYRVAANGDCGISAEGTGVFIEAFAEIRRAGENARNEAEANARLIVSAFTLAAENERLKAELAAANQARAVAEANLEFRAMSNVGLRELIAKMVALGEQSATGFYNVVQMRVLNSANTDAANDLIAKWDDLIARAKGAAAS